MWIKVSESYRRSRCRTNGIGDVISPNRLGSMCMRRNIFRLKRPAARINPHKSQASASTQRTARRSG